MKPQPKVQILFDQGSAKIAEDGLIFQPPYYFGVTDGLSGVYLPSEGPRLFNERTGGQLASSIISAAFASFEQKPLADVLRAANSLLAETFLETGLSMNDAAFLPGACFVICQITDDRVDIIQGGDCLAVWQLQDGTLGATCNRNYDYEQFLGCTISKLMKKHSANRQKMWAEFRPILIQERRDYINTPKGCLCVLNGQPQFEKYWQMVSLGRDQVKTLILFSDGLVPFEMTFQTSTLAEYLISCYQFEKLHSILARTRALAAVKKAETHEDFPEATAIALEF